MHDGAAIVEPTTLSASWYHDPAVFAAERERIFAPAWHLIGSLSQLAAPGAYIADEIAGRGVFVIRGRDGVLRGFHNVCRHRAAPLLAEGVGQCAVLRCPYHRWIYDEAGALRRAPDFGPLDRAAYGLFPIQVETWRGLVFASIAREPALLLAQLGGMAEAVAPYPIETFARTDAVTFDIACNWKTYTDNFVEGYHIPSIHPYLSSVVECDSFATEIRGNAVLMSAPQRDGSIYDGVWLWCWPNLTLSVFRDGMNTSRIMPVDRNHVRVRYDFYFADTSPETQASRRRTAETCAGIIREDFGICERSQRNLEMSPYVSGPLSGLQEAGVIRFHGEVRRALAGAPDLPR